MDAHHHADLADHEVGNRRDRRQHRQRRRADSYQLPAERRQVALRLHFHVARHALARGRRRKEDGSGVEGSWFVVRGSWLVIRNRNHERGEAVFLRHRLGNETPARDERRSAVGVRQRIFGEVFRHLKSLEARTKVGQRRRLSSRRLDGHRHEEVATGIDRVLLHVHRDADTVAAQVGHLRGGDRTEARHREKRQSASAPQHRSHVFSCRKHAANITHSSCACKPESKQTRNR